MELYWVLDTVILYWVPDTVLLYWVPVTVIMEQLHGNETSIGKQLLNNLNVFIEYKLREKEGERRRNGSNNKDKGGFGARKRRKLKRTEAARRRTTPQSPPPSGYSAPPPSQPTEPCGRCPLVCTCMPPTSSLSVSTSSLTPSPSSSPALAPPNDDELPNLEPVYLTDNLIFSQMAELDKIVSGALGIRAESKVDMKQIIVKVKELAKENVDQGNILKMLAGAKLKP